MIRERELTFFAKALAGLAIVASAMSVNSVFAAGGAAGHSLVTPTSLEAKWDGQSGTQQAAIGGVIAQWQADAEGKVSHNDYRPSAWGAPSELMIVKYQSIELDSELVKAKAIAKYRPSAWGAPATLLALPGFETAGGDQAYAGLIQTDSDYSSALKLHR